MAIIYQSAMWKTFVTPYTPLMVFFFSVIPARFAEATARRAKAGIQVKKIQAWIPAFAGMTRGECERWKTFLLYLGLLCGMVGGAYSVRAAPDSIPIANPLGPNVKTIPQLLVAVTTRLTPFVITLATFSILIVGFQFVFAVARGDQNGITKARTNFIWVLVGTAIVVGATVIVTAVETFLKTLST